MEKDEAATEIEAECLRVTGGVLLTADAVAEGSRFALPRLPCVDGHEDPPKCGQRRGVGGNKTGDDRFYEAFVSIADRIYDQHLKELSAEQPKCPPV